MTTAPDPRSGILFTDQYQLTMAQLYFEQDLHERDAQFDMFFRRYPDYGRHQAGYCVAAGLEPLLDWMEWASFTAGDLEVLAAQRNRDDSPRFSGGFLEWLEANGDFSSIELHAIPEGRVVHPHAPLAIVRGPLAMAQILETALLAHLNYPTLIATKASRIWEAARGGSVLEFGLRRGPLWGANDGARAALIGGCDFTSNVGLSSSVGVDPKGTHAHSMVQVFMALGGGELEAFRAYAGLYPDDCVLLVDTIDTIESGVPNAITVFEELRAAGHQAVGIRLDSGDLAYLSIQAARLLDAAGFPDVGIVLSSNLDELAIWQILSQIDIEAPRYGVDPEALVGRLVYGTGTRLITSQGASSLDGVCKLVAVDDAEGRSVPAIKVSDNRAKTPIPGRKSVWRVYDRRGIATADVIGLIDERPGRDNTLELHDPFRQGVGRTLKSPDIAELEPLLERAFHSGSKTRPAPDLDTMRERRETDLARLDPGVRRLVNPHIYHVSLTDAVARLRSNLVEELVGE
ncbi:MAG: nicotinate phosphoribosyltransferase [Acidimicrobiia bacterium]|nr:nicotinate phosphoribosyltransferase [Acidimicrobiia bacterium]